MRKKFKMQLENKIYSVEELNEIYLKLKKSNGDQIIYGDNIGNFYHFIKVDHGLQFISFEKNQVKIMKGFHN